MYNFANCRGILFFLFSPVDHIYNICFAISESDSELSDTDSVLFSPNFPSDLRQLDSHMVGSQHHMDFEESLEMSRVLLVATLLTNLVTATPESALGATTSPLVTLDDDDEFSCTSTLARTLSVGTAPLPVWRDNARCVTSSPTALRFAFLSAYSHHSGLRQLGVQLLCCLRIPLDPPEHHLPSSSIQCPLEWTPLIELGGGCRLGEASLRFLYHSLLNSHDRADIIGGRWLYFDVLFVRF